MAKLIPDAIIDEQLEPLALATILIICSAQPATYAEAAATYDLVTHILTAGDFSKADGDTSGRKLILAAQNGVTIDHSGTATHFFLGISATSKFLYVGTLTPQALTSGNLANFPATDIDEIRDVA